MTTCIPYAFGVPGMSNQAPNWGWSNATRVIDTWDQTRPPEESAVKDPRWRGAFNRGFGIGTAEEASFRAVFHESGGKRHLYLSWHVKFDADPGSTIDQVYMLIDPSSGGGLPLVAELTPFNDNADHLDATPLSSIKAGRRRNVAAGTDPAGSMEDFANPPNWLNETRAWRIGAGSTQGQWAIHMRIPVDPAATDVNGNAGLRLTGQFGMWFEMRIKTVTTTGIPMSVVLRLNHPAGVSLTGMGLVYPDPAISANRETCGFGSLTDPSCPASGAISIGYLDVGTTNNPSSYIDPVNTNNFFAQPTNNTGSLVAKNAINASFRLANWGSVADRPNAPWTTIQSGVLNSDEIPDATRANASNDIRFLKGNMAAQFPKVVADAHQCMLVELSGAGLVFNPASVYRNMDFVINSKVVRSAEISVEGLKPISNRARDVYLAVETLNMPSKAKADLGVFGPLLANGLKLEPSKDPQSLYAKLNAAQRLLKKRYNEKEYLTAERRLGLMLDLLREVRVTADDLDQLFPTLRVHVYVDSGETWAVDKVTYPLLELQSSFGYYAYHEGPFLGFNNQLRGAIRVAPSFYVLRVPNHGAAKITTIVHGISARDKEAIEKDEPIRPWPKKPRATKGG